MRAQTHRVANGLLAAGLKRGSKAAVYSPNHAAAYACLLGIVRAGVTWAPVNARNALEENLYILGNTDVEFLFYHSSFEASLPRIREACPKIRDFVCLDLPSFDDWLATPEGDGARPARRSRRRGVPGELGRHDRPAQGRADHQPQHRDHELDLLGLHAGRARRRSI